MDLAARYLKRAEKLHPGTIKFLTEQKVRVLTPKSADALDRIDWEFSNFQARRKSPGDRDLGLYLPGVKLFGKRIEKPSIIVEPRQPHPELTLLHEYAHARRDQALQAKKIRDFVGGGEREADRFEWRMFDKQILSQFRAKKRRSRKR